MLSRGDVDTLLAAEKIANQLAELLEREGFSAGELPRHRRVRLGQVSQAANATGDAIFELLNMATHYAELPEAKAGLERRREEWHAG